MDWRNKESDYSSVENLKWDENDFPTRMRDTVICNVRSKGIQVSLGNEISNFTTTLENLRLKECDECKDYIKSINKEHIDYFNNIEEEEVVPIFKTRELSTFQLVVQGPEILNFQGTKQSPADIAPYWKKDSRMWLWKTVRLARKIRDTNATDDIISKTDLYRELI